MYTIVLPVILSTVPDGLLRQFISVGTEAMQGWLVPRKTIYLSSNYQGLEPRQRVFLEFLTENYCAKWTK